jgi:DNA/RNA-binding domain of Phe-tRNA-synthetase-like protein
MRKEIGWTPAVIKKPWLASFNDDPESKMSFYIEKRILEQAPRTRLAIVEFDDVSIGFGHANLDDMRLRVANRVRDELRNATMLKQVPQIAGTEELLGLFDSDMRRTVTLAERILRTILESGPMPVENDALDATTLLTLYYKLPVFLHDTRTLRGDIGLVVGRANREFEVMQGHDAIRTEGRLFLKDDLGYFASPIAAGKRGLVSERSSSLLLTALFPQNVGDSIVRDFLKRSANWIQSLVGGEVLREGMVGDAEMTE